VSTHVTIPKPEPPPLPANAYCPTCGQVLPPLQIQEFPKAMYKLVPKPSPTKPWEEEEELQTVIVQNPDEEKKEGREGYSTQVPEPKQPGDHLKQHQDQHGQQQQHNQHNKKAQ
jgi:hypothetical protein